MKYFVDNKIKYVIGRNNLALTIFVPYDCPNHCPFCTSKKDYAKLDSIKTSKYMENIFESISMALSIPYIQDVVITGGEPFANLNYLQDLLDYLFTYRKNVFINTTLPVKDDSEALDVLQFILKNEEKIQGINISRHMCLKTNLEKDSLINALHNMTSIPLRINSVLLGVKAEQTKVEEFIKQYAPIVNSINFRGDYTKVKDQNDLRTLDHPLLDILFKMSGLFYLTSGGCLVCNNNDFLYITNENRRVYVSLHRGYEHSLVIKENNYIINDIIIKQDGSIFLDWDNYPLSEEIVLEIRKQWGDSENE